MLKKKIISSVQIAIPIPTMINNTGANSNAIAIPNGICQIKCMTEVSKCISMLMHKYKHTILQIRYIQRTGDISKIFWFIFNVFITIYLI